MAPFAYISILLAIVAAVPLIHSWGKINVSYDTFLPFIPEYSYKNAYQWTDRYNGAYTLNSYFVWISSIFVPTKLGLSLYQSASVMQFAIFWLSGIGIVKIFNLYNKRSEYVAIIPAVSFIYSPYLLDFMLYQLGTIGIVWSIYFFLKFIHTKQFVFIDILGIALALGTITDLPNPKYHFLLLVTFLVLLLLSLALRLLSWSDIRRNIKQFVGLALLTLYLLMPFFTFINSYSSFNSTPINIKKNYASMGETLDFGVAQIHKMIRLFHTPNILELVRKQIESPFLFLTYYILPILVLGIFPFLMLKKKGVEKKHYFILYFLAVFYVVFSKGANPPFGILYEFILKLPILAFLRTTAGLVVFAGIFYSLIIGLLFGELFAHNQRREASVALMLLLIFLWGYPIWTGKYFYNFLDSTAKYPTYGIVIPEAYFEAAKAIAKNDLDAKIDVYPSQDGYQYNSWGYYGIVYYPWLMKQPVINFPKKTTEGKEQSMVNVRYFLYDKTAAHQEYERYSIPTTTPVYASKYLDLFELPVSSFIPHIYVSSKNIITSKVPASYLNDQEKKELMGYFQPMDSPEVLLTIPKIILDKPMVEFKKINPTKYRVRLHRAVGRFPIIFEENFHPLWNLYIGRYPSIKAVGQNVRISTTSSQDNYRATQSDVVTYQKNSAISVSGVKYISKNFHGSIQNDNLDTGTFLETLTLTHTNAKHVKANGYFNSWLIDSRLLCENNNKCIKNLDGTYEIELVIEFGPQRAVDISSMLSLITLLSYSGYIALPYFKQRLRYE